MKKREASLKAWREKRKLSQADAAKLFGITQGHWSHIETHRRRPSMALAIRLHQQTGVPFEALAEMRSHE